MKLSSPKISFFCVSGKWKRKVKNPHSEEISYISGNGSFYYLLTAQASTYLINHFSRKQSVGPHMVASTSTTCAALV